MTTQKKCSTCYGYGFWPDGTAPMGPMDASDGMPTQACPTCGANPNPITPRGTPAMTPAESTLPIREPLKLLSWEELGKLLPTETDAAKDVFSMAEIDELLDTLTVALRRLAYLENVEVWRTKKDEQQRKGK